MIDRRVQLSVLVVAVGSLLLLYGSEIPLGIPGEWTWKRIPIDDGPLFDALLGLLPAAAMGCAYAGFAWVGATRLAGCSRAETTVWLVALVSAAFGWLWIVQESVPGEYRYAKPKWVLYDPGSSGYFFEARYAMKDVAPFLRGYQARMYDGDVLHVGTHPPGLFLVHRALLQVCENSPSFSQFLLDTEPAAVSAAFSELERSASLSHQPLTKSDRAALWLAVLLTRFIAAATVIPLCWLIRRRYSRVTSWQAVVFWPLIPALAVFLPKSDAVYPFLGCLFLYLWLEGRARGSVLLCLSAGLMFWLGMFLSLALLPVALLAVALGMWEFHFRQRTDADSTGKRSLFAAIAWAIVGFLAPIFLLWVYYRLNLFDVWWWNYLNHAAFYGQFTRTYWKWLLVNPLELAMSVGVPLAILSVVGWFRATRLLRRPQPLEWGPYVMLPLVIGLLWVSGKNLGEAARLWLVIMPWTVWLIAGYFERQQDFADTSGRSSQHRDWLLVLSVQVAVCIGTVSRLAGFNFAG